jgi:hypothetical protein
MRLANFIVGSIADSNTADESMTLQLRLWLWFLAAAISLSICLGTGLITGWGKWYSPSLPYRKQTEALLARHFSLSNNPVDLEFDHAWAGGGVQQVWGLGVPFWRLPFEIAARAFGQPAFPDRIALAVFIALVAYILLRVFTVQLDCSMEERQDESAAANSPPIATCHALTFPDWLRGIKASPTGIATVILLIAFPPMITLFRQKFDVHEEAVTYGYYYAVALFAGTMAFCRGLRKVSEFGVQSSRNLAASVSDRAGEESGAGNQESGGRAQESDACRSSFSVQRSAFTLYLALSLFAGLIGFVRPTVLAYGGATIVVAFLCARSAGWRWRRCVIGPALFASGLGLLYWTNLVRFGSGLEFGHRLNMTSRDLIYLSRFDAPFDHEPFLPAAKELFGALFFANYLNGFSDTVGRLVLWESPTPRMRHFYTATFDLSFLLAVFGCWLWAALSLLTLRRRLRLAPVLGDGRGEGAADRPQPSAHSFLFLAVLWSFVGSIPIFTFYLRYCVLSSMYLCDFAPAFGAAIMGGMFATTDVRTNALKVDRLFSGALLGVIIFWWIAEIALAGRLFAAMHVQSQSQVLESLDRRKLQAWPLPDHYELSVSPAALTGIGDNGKGWIQNTGETAATVVLFVSDVEKLVLDISPADGQAPNDEDYASIRAKVGLEFLQLDSIEKTDHGRRLTFNPPQRAAYRSAIQVVFVSFVPTAQFRDERSPFKLERAQWQPPNARSSDGKWPR